MFKEDSEVELLLDHPKNILHKSSEHGKPLFHHPNGTGSASRLTIQDKAEIAVLATIVGNKAAADLTGEDPANVSRMKNGVTTKGGDDNAIRAATAAKLAPIQAKAVDKVDMLLDIIQADKLGDLGIKDAAITAEKLVSIFEKITPIKDPTSNRINVIFYSPAKREVSNYPVIDVEPAVG